ncbi:MAG: tetratricopeptide repeat protein, partial [Betaproteobacteria bacterium]|nr:tetratricopeptide repeat protein [Betaproteobacteria bacterium]
FATHAPLQKVKGGGGTLQHRLLDAISRKQYEEAERLAVELTCRQPSNPMGWKALGVVLSYRGQMHEAVGSMRKSVELAPFDAEAQLNLGSALHALGQAQEAETAYRNVLALQPNSPEVLNNLGSLLCDSGRPSEAESCYQQAIALKRDYAQAYSNYGHALQMLHRLEEAETACRKAIALQPDYKNAHVNLSAVLLGLGRHHEAEACLRTVLALSPDEPNAYNNLGTALLEQGRLHEARASYERALQINPLFPECHNNLSQVKTYTPDDPHIPLLSRLVQQLHEPVARMHACFALGKACTDTGQHKEAFAILSESNRLRKALLGYSVEQDQVLFARIRQVFDVLPPAVDDVPAVSQAVLIVGMPRSGTSLVEQILASHPQVMGGGELECLNRAVSQHFSSEPVALDAVSRQVATDYAAQLDRLGSRWPHITDKMPSNFRWLGFVLWANPHLKVVHTVRDPMAACWSIFKQYFPANALGFAYDLEDLGTYYRMYEDLMAFWHEKFPGRIYDLNYERLTENQEEETRKLLDYCGLPWDERCLEFEKTQRVVRTASAAQVRQKMYKGSSKAWRPYEPYLGPLIKALGRT